MRVNSTIPKTQFIRIIISMVPFFPCLSLSFHPVLVAYFASHTAFSHNLSVIVVATASASSFIVYFSKFYATASVDTASSRIKSVTTDFVHSIFSVTEAVMN